VRVLDRDVLRALRLDAVLTQGDRGLVIAEDARRRQVPLLQTNLTQEVLEPERLLDGRGFRVEFGFAL